MNWNEHIWIIAGGVDEGVTDWSDRTVRYKQVSGTIDRYQTTNHLFVKQVLVLIQSEKGPSSSCSTAVLGLATISRFCPMALWEASTSPPRTVSSVHTYDPPPHHD